VQADALDGEQQADGHDFARRERGVWGLSYPVVYPTEQVDEKVFSRHGGATMIKAFLVKQLSLQIYLMAFANQLAHSVYVKLTAVDNNFFASYAST